MAARFIHLLLLLFLLSGWEPAGRAAVASLAPYASLEDTEWERRELAAGVELFHQSFENLYGGPQVVNLLRVNLEEPTVEVRLAAAIQSGERLAPVESIAQPAGALAAINGGFAHGGPESLNSGIFKINGEVLPFLRQETEELRFVGGAALGIDADDQWHFINRPGETWPEDLPEMQHALAGGHRLVEAGEIHSSLATFITARDRRHSGGRHPRTAIGLLPDRTALLVTVDGRHPGHSEGLTLQELAQFMIDLGCLEALNLDGGGSTTLWLRDKGVINHPSDNRSFDHEGARKVASAILILAE
jgi:hypothetical protein